MTSIVHRLLALLFLVLSIPLWPILYILVKLDSPGPFIFKQKRTGKNGKTFTIFKIRTMVKNAEELKGKYRHLNEEQEPVFKIKNDPRYTKTGKFLSLVALDELPQLINVIRGEMSLVGPRPLPLDEAAKIPKKYQVRFSVLPGMTSSWIVKGSHNLKFDRWMELDCDYVKKKSLFLDIYILFLTFQTVAKLMFLHPDDAKK